MRNTIDYNRNYNNNNNSNKRNKNSKNNYDHYCNKNNEGKKEVYIEETYKDNNDTIKENESIVLKNEVDKDKDKDIHITKDEKSKI